VINNKVPFRILVFDIVRINVEIPNLDIEGREGLIESQRSIVDVSPSNS
jgi:hypothetical protein